MKRFLCMILCALFLCSMLLVSCNNGDDSSKAPDKSSEASASKADESSVAEESSTEVSENPDDKYLNSDGLYYSAALPAFKDEWKSFDTFRVLVYSNVKQDTYFNEEVEVLYDTTDEAIATAVTTRNTWIEDKYGVKIKAVAVDDVLVTIRSEIVGGTDTYDAAMPFMSACAVLAQEGSLEDLRDYSDYIDLEAPWWDHNATSSLSVANKVYFTTGDISFMQKIVSSGVAFNRKLMSDYFRDTDMYQLVRDNEWTIDKYYEMCKEVTQQIVDDGVMDEKDLWGSMGAGIALYYGAGETLCTKNADDIPEIALGSDERSITVAQKIRGYLDEKKTWYVTADDWTDKSINKWAETVRVFGEDQALFDAFAFSALKKFRAYSVNYGIVPVPKYDVEQDEYYSTCAANYANGICIPSSVKDPEFSAYMIELMAIGGKNYISDAYYDAVLKGKDMNLQDDEDMLDIIFGNIVYDVATVYGFSGISDVFNKSTAGTIKSNLETQKGAIEDAIATVVDAYNSNN